MLKELRIRDLAIVEDAVIPFGGGLNVMTGSTGAGKSIILAAVELLSGARARKSLIRKGAAQLSVEGIFSVSDGWRLKGEFGMGSGETELSIRRELSSDGRNRIWINGLLSTVSAAHEASGALIELHGQHEQHKYLDPTNHLSYLDAWGNYGAHLEKTIAAIGRFFSLSARLERIVAEDGDARRREDYLRFQLRELEELKLEPGIDRALESRMKRIEHRQKYIDALEEARSLLEGEGGSALERLSRSARALESIASIDASWREAAEQLVSARIAIQDVARRVSRSLAASGEAEEDAESIQARLAGIQRASRKHGLDCDGLIAKRDEIRKTLSSLDSGSAEIEDARRERAACERDLTPLLDSLSAKRTACAAVLGKQVTEELQKLGMKGARFEAAVERIEKNALQGAPLEIHLTPRGLDRVEFRIRTNVGEDMHPLADIASGGELSRITLVLKKLEVEEKSIPTLIFDEIDAGLGADLGGVVAERLSGLARVYQIICITHLPQVAARASRHIRVLKQVKGDRTVATARTLEGRERVGEIARMLGGKGKLREDLAEELLQND